MVESKKPMIVLSFHDCELHCCHLDGYHFYFKDAEAAKEWLV